MHEVEVGLALLKCCWEDGVGGGVECSNDEVKGGIFFAIFLGVLCNEPEDDMVED